MEKTVKSKISDIVIKRFVKSNTVKWQTAFTLPLLLIPAGLRSLTGILTNKLYNIILKKAINFPSYRDLYYSWLHSHWIGLHWTAND